MGTGASLVNAWIVNRRTKRTIRNITRNNEARRNITRYEPSDIEAFIESDAQLGSYIVSGGIPTNRSRVASSIVACSLSQNIPVIVLHEGNIELENMIDVATDFTTNKVIIARNTSVYDPFYNRSNQEICNLIINSAQQTFRISAIGQQYIVGIIEFIKSKNIPPFCEMLVRCPYDDLFNKIDDALVNGYITDQKAIQIRNQLMQGQNERANVQTFFSQLAYQGAGVLSNKGSRNFAVNIKTAVEHNGMLMIDIGSSTNDILLNLIVNEVKEVLAAGKKIMLVLDGININSNEVLSKVIKSLSSRCLTTMLSDDVYSMLGADDNLFNSFVGNASKCIVFSHSMGVSCNKWSEVFGYYDVDKVSQNTGTNQNYQWGYGFGSSNSISVATNREFIVKPEELARLAPTEVYILDRNARELAYTTLR
jgi:hypothetical protein